MVDAVAQGRRAAADIDRYLGGDGDVSVRLLDDTALDPVLANAAQFCALARLEPPSVAALEAASSFALVEAAFDAVTAVAEAQRCLRCALRLHLRRNPDPPAALLTFDAATIAAVPAVAGVLRLLDTNRAVYAIRGVADVHAELAALLESSQKARYLLWEEDPLYTKRESELILEFLREHGRMPPGEGDDDLDDLF